VLHLQQDWTPCSRLPISVHRCYRIPGLLQVPTTQNYFQQQNYPQFTESDDLEELDPEEVAAATTFRPPRSSYGARPPSGPAKTTTPPVTKPSSLPLLDSRPSASTDASTPWPCRQHNVRGCERCLIVPTATHHCQALIAICQDCGQHHPVVADACLAYCKDTNMPVADGLLENKPVQVLRDTGCHSMWITRLWNQTHWSRSKVRPH